MTAWYIGLYTLPEIAHFTWLLLQVWRADLSGVCDGRVDIEHHHQIIFNFLPLINKLVTVGLSFLLLCTSAMLLLNMINIFHFSFQLYP